LVFYSRAFLFVLFAPFAFITNIYKKDSSKKML
jgi:hypothetical protein